MNSKNIRTVINWEFKKHIKNPAFLLFTFALPAIIVIAGFIPSLIMGKMNTETKYLWALDETTVLAPYLKESFANSRFDLEFVDGSLAERKEMMVDAKINGLLYIDGQTLTTGEIQLFITDIMNFDLSEVQQLTQPAYTLYRLEESGIAPEEYMAFLAPITIRLQSVSGEMDNALAFIVPLFTGLLLFISLLFSGQVLMQSVIKEKRSRIVEILLSSLTAGELLAGKILAFGGLVLIQVSIWLGSGLTVASRFIDLGAIGIDLSMVLQVLPYFILGYLMLATLSAAVAAMMKEAETGSQTHGLIFLIPTLPIMLSVPITMAPNGFLPRLLSFIPIFTPATMLLRIGITQVPLWEIVITSALLLAATLLLLVLGARLYRGSLLRFGGTISIKDFVSMLKTNKY